MNLRTPLVILILASPCLADVKRPQVPAVLDIAVAPRPFDVQQARAALGLQGLAGPISSVKAGISGPLKTDSAAAALSASPLPAGTTTASAGVTGDLRLNSVDCDSPDALKAAMAAGVIRAVRYVGEADPAVTYVTEHPEQPFVVIVDIDHLSGAALKTLAAPNIVAIIVGHFHAFDARPENYPERAQDVMRMGRAIRLVSDAPVLLAVSSLNGVTRRTEKSWTDAFGEDLVGFDGWAIYNLNQWPAFLESPANLRRVILSRLGLPEKPCVLLDFLGTPAEYPAERAKYISAVWKAKAGLLMKALKDQGWRGLIVYATHPADAGIKTAALAGN
jgi:hypothetical protein